MTPLDFAWKHIGDVVTAPNGLGGQCVDLANLWLLEAYGLPHVYADAVNWRLAHIPGWHWVQNGPTNYPPPGALVVWGPNAPWGIGQAGHIALVLAADANHILTLDQNWPEHAPTSVHLHDYRGVLGWQQPG